MFYNSLTFNRFGTKDKFSVLRLNFLLLQHKSCINANYNTKNIEYALPYDDFVVLSVFIVRNIMVVWIGALPYQLFDQSVSLIWRTLVGSCQLMKHNLSGDCCH